MQRFPRLFASVFVLFHILACGREPSAAAPEAAQTSSSPTGLFGLPTGTLGTNSIPLSLLSPQVQVCALTASMTCGTVVANLTATYDLVAKKFVLRWLTPSAIDRTLTYRATMFLFGAPVAYSDVVIIDGDVTPLSFKLLVSQVSPLPPSGGTVSVPPTGAAIISADGSMSLVIPAGALTAATSITIGPSTVFPATEGVAGPAYELGPEGLVFGAPVTMTVRYNPASVPVWADEDELGLLVTSPDDEWDEDEGTSVNLANHTVTTQIADFIAIPTPDPNEDPIAMPLVQPLSAAPVARPRLVHVAPMVMSHHLSSTPAAFKLSTAAKQRLLPLNHSKGLAPGANGVPTLLTSRTRHYATLPSGTGVATVSRHGLVKTGVPGSIAIPVRSGRARRISQLTVVPRPIIVSFAASPAQVQSGQGTSLIATFFNGTGTVQPGGVSIASGVSLSVPAVTSDTTYTLTVTNPAGDVTTQTTAVTLCVLTKRRESRFYSEKYYGQDGGPFGQSFNDGFGGACSSGWTREAVTRPAFNGAGVCDPRWASSDVTNCSVSVHIGVPIFQNTSCHVVAYESREVPGQPPLCTTP
jgi:hypothetical protein